LPYFEPVPDVEVNVVIDEIERPIPGAVPGGPPLIVRAQVFPLEASWIEPFIGPALH
jgi:hypothetical protein